MTLTPIWQLRMEHAYCLDAPELPRWRFELLSDAPGVCLRPLADGVALYADAQQTPQDVLLVAIAAGDPLFDNYTVGLNAPAGQLPLWSATSRDAVAGPQPLQPAGCVAAQWPGQRLVVALPSAGGAPLYRLAVASRATVWKYLLLGEPRDWGDLQLQVIDPEADVSFRAAERETLADGSAATAIVSQAPVALRHRALRRFELRGTPRNGAERVLIRHLPVAHARGFGQIDPSGALVSEIFVRP